MFNAAEWSLYGYGELQKDMGTYGEMLHTTNAFLAGTAAIAPLAVLPRIVANSWPMLIGINHAPSPTTRC